MFIEFCGYAINFSRVDIIQLEDKEKNQYSRPYWIKVFIGDRDFLEWYKTKKERDTRYKKILHLLSGES